MAYGYQLLLDLYECDPEACDDLSLCYRYLDEMVAHLGMSKQAPPSIFRTDASSVPQHAGLSGWVPLIESSIVIHTLVPDAYISIDVYSCQPFDYDNAITFTQSFFRPQKLGSQTLIRGSDLWANV
jgi:S-adenosylmethionine decarboxylase